jgi:hypothetical protein
MRNTSRYKQHAVTYPLTLFIAHSLLSLSLVADCNIRNIHFNTSNFQQTNYITTALCHNVIKYLPLFQMHINFHVDVLATKTYCNFIISFTYLLIFVKNMNTLQVLRFSQWYI